MRLYFKLLSANLRSQLQHRASFVLDAFATALANGLEFIAFMLVFTRFGSIGGWTFWQVAFLWGLSETAFGTMDMIFSGFDPGYFAQLIKRGDFDRVLVRPVHLPVQMFAAEFVLRRVGRIAQGGLIFALALMNLTIDWTPVKLAYLPLVFVSAVAFYGALFTFGAALCFWTTESIEVINVFTYGGTTMASYPMHIYNDFLRRVFTFVVPTALMIYYPALFFFDLPDPTGLPKLAQFLAPLAGFGLLALAFAVWQAGVRRYQSVGN
jgi:ABC-2 type transport system permease protein